MKTALAETNQDTSPLAGGIRVGAGGCFFLNRGSVGGMRVVTPNPPDSALRSSNSRTYEKIIRSERLLLPLLEEVGKKCFHPIDLLCRVLLDCF